MRSLCLGAGESYSTIRWPPGGTRPDSARNSSSSSPVLSPAEGPAARRSEASPPVAGAGWQRTTSGQLRRGTADTVSFLDEDDSGPPDFAEDNDGNGQTRRGA